MQIKINYVISILSNIEITSDNNEGNFVDFNLVNLDSQNEVLSIWIPYNKILKDDEFVSFKTEQDAKEFCKQNLKDVEFKIDKTYKYEK